MPQYNGPGYFFVEVLVHVLRNYLAWFLLFAILVPAPFALMTMARGGFEEAVESLFPSFQLWSVSSWLSFAHVMTFFLFPIYFAPRFPYMSPYLSFAQAGVIGALLLAVNWTLATGNWAGETLLTRFLWAATVTAGVAATGALTFGLLGTGIFRWGPLRWLGWFVVGRTPYEAFVASKTPQAAKPA
jgi:hypothetical protein